MFYISKSEFDRKVAKNDQIMRQYPIITIIGLFMSFALFVAVGKPVVAYLANAIQWNQYKSSFFGAEGTALARQTWNELVAELNVISEMGWLGHMLVEMPICRAAVMAVAAFALVMLVYFLKNTGEAIIDNWKEIWKGVFMVAEAIRIIALAMWRAATIVADAIGKGLAMAAKGMYIVLRTIILVIAIAIGKTRTLFCEIRGVYRCWKNEQYQPKYLKHK